MQQFNPFQRSDSPWRLMEGIKLLPKIDIVTDILLLGHVASQGISAEQRHNYPTNWSWDVAIQTS